MANITFTGDPHVMQASANSTAACHAELEGHLRALTGVQDGMQVALVSPGAGQAVNTALGNAYVAGKALSGSLQEIIDTLSQFGVTVDVQDTDAASRVHAAAGSAGILGDTGSVAPSGTPAIDTSSWA
ncbi:hypothetical protein F3087_40320 [Nocardia colli]|uniref:PE domain-containing protein n=1 Tax=Nocardia colli TaxID=2545717 RepID=A0A5N0E1C4_9NOCA|nr:hypothetical protein [Nocardia colli]KAA8881914.1 hypothetical protein F3087_40320 [Nocardia colli]